MRLKTARCMYSPCEGSRWVASTKVESDGVTQSYVQRDPHELAFEGVFRAPASLSLSKDFCTPDCAKAKVVSDRWTPVFCQKQDSTARWAVCSCPSATQRMVVGISGAAIVKRFVLTFDRRKPDG